MRVLFINEVCGVTSTGKISCELADKLTAEGHECKVAYGRHGTVPDKWRHYAVRIGTDMDVRLHAVGTRLLDKHGLGSKKATEKFLEWAENYAPDMVWLHNIHGYYINYELLFAWIKKHPDMEVKWTLHDCWAFTGHCAFFTMVGCDKWKTSCSHCPQKKSYPSAVLKSNCDNNFRRKKASFTGVKNMTIVTPSQWLADLVKQSFLSEYPVEVIYNTIDTSVFKPTQGDFKEKYSLQDKKIILGVANVWDKRKGLDDFLKLRELLGEKYVIVLIGLSQKQLEELPNGIIGIKRTNNQAELAEIYTAADLFFNPTYEDNYPTVNLEAEACGTRVVTYRTGGAPETIRREDSVVIECGDVAAAKNICMGI